MEKNAPFFMDLSGANVTLDHTRSEDGSHSDSTSVASALV